MSLFFLNICMCPTYVLCDYRGQRKASKLLKLELQTVVNYYVIAGNGTWVLCKSKNHSLVPALRRLSTIPNSKPPEF